MFQGGFYPRLVKAEVDGDVIYADFLVVFRTYC